MLRKVFSGSQKSTLGDVIAELSDMIDRTFTSDEDRKKWQLQIEKLYAFNKNSFIAGGRSAIAWAFAVVVLYQAVIRDALIIVTGNENVPKGMELDELIGHAIRFLMGV